MKKYNLKNTLKYISLLQENSLKMYSSLNDCLRPYFKNNHLNTKVIQIFHCNGCILKSHVFYKNNPFITNYYRIHKVYNDSVVLLLLRLDGSSFYSSKEYITISLKCIGAIKCIQDVLVSNL